MRTLRRNSLATSSAWRIPTPRCAGMATGQRTATETPEPFAGALPGEVGQSFEGGSIRRAVSAIGSSEQQQWSSAHTTTRTPRSTTHSHPAHPISIVLEPTSSIPMSISRIGRRPVRIKGCKVLPARTANFWTPRRCVRTWCRRQHLRVPGRAPPSAVPARSGSTTCFPLAGAGPSVPADLAAPGGFAGRAAPTQRPISSSECHSSARWGSRWPRPICWTNTARISPTPVAEGALMP